MHRYTAENLINESLSRGAAAICAHAITVSRYDLTAEVVRAQRGDRRATERVVLMTCRLVQQIAARTFLAWHPRIPDYASYDDVYQEALTGVLRAIDKYDADSGYAFTTYATNWIKMRATRATQKTIGLMHIPEHSINDLELDDARSAIHARSLDEPLKSWEGGDENTLGSLVASDEDIEDDIVDRDEMQDTARRILAACDERQQTALMMRSSGATWEQIGEAVGMTREGARQMYAKTRSQVAREVCSQA